MKSYNITNLYADGSARKKTLLELGKEIKVNDPNTVIEIVSYKKGNIWTGHGKNMLSDLLVDFCKQCVQDIEIDKYGISIFVR